MKTKVRKEERGYCADYCIGCRSIHAFSVTDLFKVTQISVISLGKGEWIGTDLFCCNCEHQIVLNPAAIATQPSPDAMEQMLAAVPERVRAGWAARLKEDQLLRETPEALAPDMRRAYIVEAFVRQETLLASRKAKETILDPHAKKVFGIWALFFLAVVIIGPMIASWEWVSDLIHNLGQSSGGVGVMLVVGSGLGPWSMWCLPNGRDTFARLFIRNWPNSCIC